MEYSQDYSSEAAGIMAGIFGTILLIYLAMYVLMVISLWKVFEKAGKPGWAAIIPIYNTLVMIEIVGKPTIWLLWCLIPCVNFVFAIWLINLMSKSFGQGEGFTIGMIFLPFIFWPILGFGNSRYLGPSAAEAQNPFGGGQNPYQTNNPYNQPPNNPNSGNV